MTVRTCPRCELRFGYVTELRDHLVTDHDVDPRRLEPNPVRAGRYVARRATDVTLPTAHAEAAPLRVLFATDGQGPARAAERLLTRIADPRRVDVTVLGVSTFDPASTGGARDVGHFDPVAARRHVTRIVDSAARRLADAGYHTFTKVLHDDATLRILDASTDADLVVLGARPWRDDTGIGRLLRRHRSARHVETSTRDDGDAQPATRSDSVSTRVLHEADVPVLVVRTTWPVPADAYEFHGAQPRARVLVGADGSAAADEAVRTLTRLADPRRVAATVLTVSEPDPNLDVHFPEASAPVVMVGTRIAAVDDETARQVRRRHRDRAEGIAGAAASTLRAAGFAVRAEVADGAPRHALLDRVRDDRVDLVVVGSRGLGPVRRWLHGSVSETLVHDAPASLVAHAPGRERDGDVASANGRRAPADDASAVGRHPSIPR